MAVQQADPSQSDTSPLRGTLFIVSAPSGAGKTSLVRALTGSDPGVTVSVSYTTRAPREGETDGIDYHFVGHDRFQAMIGDDGFLEYARVFDHYYGTSRAAVAERLDAGGDVILEIDWQGARQVRCILPEAVSIFILPPSRAALLERLKARKQDDEAVIRRRMRDAVDEISHYSEYDFLVVNDRFDEAVDDLRAVVRARRLRRERQAAQHQALLRELHGGQTAGDGRG